MSFTPEKPLRKPASRAATPLVSSDEQNDNPPSPRPGVPSKQASVPRLDSLFNFEIVVFQVEDTLFQVLKNGFNVPGTIFEAMFTLPVPTPESDSDNLAREGSTLENPIHLSGITATDFRAFLKVLYPFIGPSAPLAYRDWVGVLKLSTMWDFNEIRAKAISNLSILIVHKTAAERISLGRTYQVANWLRDEYLKLARKTDLELDELRDPSGISLDWETIAKILSIREKNLLRQLKAGQACSSTGCHTCSSSNSSSPWGDDREPTRFGWNTEFIDCHCHLPAVVDSVFGDEFQAMKDPADLPPVNPNTSKKKSKGKRA